MQWIYEQAAWPQFQWDDTQFVNQLAEFRHRQGRLLGQMGAMGFDLIQEASLNNLTQDVVKSSAIEGEMLDIQEVRSSLARRLGIAVESVSHPSRDVEAIVEVTLDATTNYKAPLTKNRLCNWHKCLFPTGRSGLSKITVGDWRPASSGEMQVISGPMGRAKVHFQAPHADTLEDNMRQFIDWFEFSSDLDPILKASLAHFWFVTIHPFEDGNGRIARAISDMALARADQTAHRFYSMSSQIETDRKSYYQILEQQQRGDLDVTPWIVWFLSCLTRAIDRSELVMETVFHKADLWQALRSYPTNDRQRRVLNRMFEDFKGFMSTSKYAKLAKYSADTALRDIKDLIKAGVLIQNERRGRSTSYRLASREELRASSGA